MNAWDVLSLILVGVTGIIAVLMLWLGAGVGLNWLYWRRLHRRTRNVPPQAGQVWIRPPGDQYTIVRVDSAGWVQVRLLGSEWGMGPLTWRHQVVMDRLYLERGPR